ncbi:hypothetical protein [Brucella sp. IR073]|uniref:hypothetical protein n=1 Tax=unclassified Brucella TaxID=2632610 RepID=UPI003B987121
MPIPIRPIWNIAQGTFAIISLLLLGATTTIAATCVPPASFKDSSVPAAANEAWVARTEAVDVKGRLQDVVRKVESADLGDIIDERGSLPRVLGTYNLTKGQFGKAGSRRLVCLSDGSTLVEQVLERTLASDLYTFRYVVWNYTSEQAGAIDYSVGTFIYRPLSPDSTSIEWTYAFQLNRERFPGNLGALGRFLFRVSFLDREYAEMMRRTLDNIQTVATR